MEALALDVKCFDAFEELIGGQLLAIDEGQSAASLCIVATDERIRRRVGVHPRPSVPATGP